MGMGSAVMGGGGGTGGTKTPTTATNTGAPNWTSGATGNSAMAAQPPTATGGASGAVGPEPGTDAYNQMNTQLSTAPMQSLVNMFQQGGMNPAMQAAMQNLLGSSGSNAQMDEAANLFKQLGTSGTENFQNLYSAAGQPGANQQYLSGVAAGDYLKSNPYVEDIVRRGQDEAGTGVNQMFAAGGRYGSGMNQGTLADSYQKIGNQYRGQEYEAERQRQQQAAGAISQEQLGRMGIQSGAASGVGGLQTAGAQGLGGLGTSSMSNWLNAQNAAAGIGNAGQQNLLGGMGQLSNVQNNKMFDATQQAGVGREVDTASQNQINDLINQWTQGDMSGWAKLGGLLSAGTGSAGNWGTQSGSTTQSSQPGGAQIAGGILSILGMLSDRRTKTDIEPLGARLAGVPLYRFRYRADRTKALQIGVMADEAKALHPDAVFASEGYDYVNYALLHARHLGAM